MAREELKKGRDFAREFIEKNPQHREEALDLYQLCVDEIEEGGSPQHELDLFIESCEQLLEDDED